MSRLRWPGAKEQARALARTLAIADAPRTRLRCDRVVPRRTTRLSTSVLSNSNDPMKSALFVDFDNVFSSLRRLDPVAAERFAMRPDLWMHWLTDTLQPPPHAPDAQGRRVLVRRCYLNPQAYQRFRPAFNRVGFEIVDCPPMTREGKTSTDIHMVLDIVDLLQHQVHYDEFVVFSADADFTPVLRKLRRWDRRTTVLAIGFPSAAYQASADLLIDQDEFVRSGLGFVESDEEQAGEVAPTSARPLASDIVREIGPWVRRIVGDSPKELMLSTLASKAIQDIQGLEPATWAGFASFRKLMDATALSPLVVDWERGTIRDPARHPMRTDSPKLRIDAAKHPSNLLDEAARWVQAEVRRASRPVACAQLAQLLVAKHPPLAVDWDGKGSFRKFMDALDIGELKLDWKQGGVVKDPEWITPTPIPDTPGWGTGEHFLPAIRQIHVATGMPLMSSAELQGLLQALVEDVARTPFSLSDTSKRVRDRCRQSGLGVSRAEVSYVLKGILFAGHAFGEDQDHALVLARKFLDSVRTLCKREELDLDEPLERALEAWAITAPASFSRAPR